ncbi:MAG: methylenetetrahydrofolate reductase [NAD(P)H] [Candidatus Contendobacter odensis]|uniref:Methylenetetrahydrofolate reductase n=1 Tax=Candidatus Contendibacter odensensis TaxID=1400860 RepID=A0A2G6PFA1_9GAMM|nr:MAG: methylenetetrahydrofolate reductase [NAD(P)H] [Candidatus Contendobacter odensis]
MSTPSDGCRIFSCEFFPPISAEGMTRLQKTRQHLLSMHPAYFSVTYGAGGSTRNRTVEAVLDIQANSGIPAAPHLTCIASIRDQIKELLEFYQAHGIRRIVALRGDMPSGMRDSGELRYANELVEFIRAEFGDYFHLEVAAYPEYHPQATTPEHDLDNFKRKVDAGADSAITQYFYNADAYFRFIDNCNRLRISIPIVPGIMPITNYTQLARFSDACGAEIPRWVRKKLESFGDDRTAIRAFGLDVVSELCQKLLDSGAPGLHFYTMNQSTATLAIIERLNLTIAMPTTNRGAEPRGC